MIWYWDDPIGSLLVFVSVMLPPLLPAVPVLVLATWARRRASRVASTAGELAIDAAGLASAILEGGGAPSRLLAPAPGPLADFYDPWHKEVRLSGAVAGGRTIEDLGIAAHLSGHALRDGAGSWLSKPRALLVLGSRLGGSVAWMTALAGLMMKNPDLTYRGALLSSAVGVALLALRPIERDADRRSLAALPLGLLDPEQGVGIEAFRRALDAASWAEFGSLLPGPRWNRDRKDTRAPQRRA